MKRLFFLLSFSLLATAQTSKTTIANRLIDEDSPYLQQHAHNPVHWFAWGKEAFEKAKKENKPIFLSIGYSTCHWCHVMEHESFENEAIAKILNQHYVAIKVDREEHPDLDQYYQEIYAVMNGRSGGWPLTMILTPDRKPYFSATYLPPDDRYGDGGLGAILKRMARLYHERRSDVQKRADSILSALRAGKKQGQNPIMISGEKVAKRFVKEVKSSYDPTYHGIGSAPKFPHATTIETLLDIYRLYGDEDAKMMAFGMLDAMAKGGIYDQIEGGFFRYSTDERWMIPHFEKMLYINAELLEAYANAYALDHKVRYKQVIEETIANLKERFLQEGLYMGASDADSEGKEGYYFLLSYDEALKALTRGGFAKDQAIDVLGYLGIFEMEGNFDTTLTNPYLTRETPPKDFAKAKAILRQLRAKKSYPFIDYKIQTSWNALLIKALLRVSKQVDPRYTKEALSSLEQLLKRLMRHGVLYHQSIKGKTLKIRGYLEDYAFLISALIDAYQVRYEDRYLEWAKWLMGEARKKFYQKGSWKVSEDSTGVDAEVYDASYRSGVSVMIEDLFELAILAEDRVLYTFAQKSLREYSQIVAHPSNYPYALKVMLGSKLGYTVLKSKRTRLIAHQAQINAVKYPYLLTKSQEQLDTFLACQIDRCFATQKDIGKVLNAIERIK